MINKLLTFLIIFLLISSCTGLEPRSQKSDEFLIEKKNPLVMPPDINDLPKPKEVLDENIDQENFKENLNLKDIKTQDSNTGTTNTLQESIIKRIE
tara:strand:+ start:119 stop:406 length:288 start_codon:yes stop_codon:yes gene_type:complete